MSTKTMEIMFDDLNDDAKNEYINTFGYDDNLDIYPITVIEHEED